MEPLEWHTEKRIINDLVPFEHNPRRMSKEQVDQLTTSLKKFGLAEIPAIDTDNVIVAGHQRMKVMQLLGKGDQEIDVRVPNRKLTEEEYKEYNVRSNKNTGSWDYDMLGNLFDMPELEAIGFSPEELGKIDFGDDSAKDDAAPDIPIVPQSQLGDFYQLGPHRLLCGDSTSKVDVEKLMGGNKADLVFTDPPFNVNYSGQGKETSNTILNDKMAESEFDTFLHEVFQRYSEVTKSGGAWYVFHAALTQHQFQKAIIDSGWKIKNQIIWNKPVASMGWGDYRWKHEPMFYCGKEMTEFYGDRTHTTILSMPSTDEKALKWLRTQEELEAKGYTTIWSIKRDSVNEYVHPTQKPVQLITYAIQNSSKPDDIVLDLFGGSGSTMIASEKTSRTCYSLELDPKYVDVIVQRYVDYTECEEVYKNGEPIIWKMSNEKR